jgi:hypothetical protein
MGLQQQGKGTDLFSGYEEGLRTFPLDRSPNKFSSKKS